MRGSIGTAATALVLAAGGSALLAGTALAAPAATGASPARVVVIKTANNCAGNSYTIKNGKIVKVAPNCTSSSTSTNGSGGNSGGSQGTSSQGTTTNNCAGSSTTVVNGVPTTTNGCTASANGKGGN